MAMIQPTDRDVLIVTDVQNDFMPGGPVGVPHGDEVVALANALGARFPHVILTQDWHPVSHVSFASRHPGKAVFDTVDLPYGRQILWPDHCVQESRGAALAEGLKIPSAELIIRKGCRRDMDSYSALLEADLSTATGLGAYLKARTFERIFVCGVATDFCIASTALDVRRLGFRTFVFADAVKGLDRKGSVAKAWADMDAAGIERINAGTCLA